MFPPHPRHDAVDSGLGVGLLVFPVVLLGIAARRAQPDEHSTGGDRQQARPQIAPRGRGDTVPRTNAPPAPRSQTALPVAALPSHENMSHRSYDTALTPGQHAHDRPTTIRRVQARTAHPPGACCRARAPGQAWPHANNEAVAKAARVDKPAIYRRLQ